MSAIGVNGSMPDFQSVGTSSNPVWRITRLYGVKDSMRVFETFDPSSSLGKAIIYLENVNEEFYNNSSWFP